MKSLLQFQKKQLPFKVKAVDEGGTFSGYAAAFDNVDLGRDRIHKGAFLDSLAAIKKSGDPLPALWQHNHDEPVGGYNVLAEDDKGLAVEGFLLKDDVARAREAYALMKARVVTGMSIGYLIEEDSYNEVDQVRELKRLRLVEASIVTFPMNPEARLDAVKSALATHGLPTLPDFEGFLREAGFSKSQAVAVAGHGLRYLLDRRESDGGDETPGAILKAFSGFTLPPIDFKDPK